MFAFVISIFIKNNIIPQFALVNLLIALKDMYAIKFGSEWTETFPNDFRDEVMMMHIKDITSYCASLTVVCTYYWNLQTSGN